MNGHDYSGRLTSYRSSPRKATADAGLSKSLGDIRGSHFAHVAGATSDISSIDHRGYLLKRSNQPFSQVGADSEDPVDDTHHDLSYLVRPVGHRPQHIQMSSKQKTETTKEVNLNDVPLRAPPKLNPTETVSNILASFFGLPNIDPTMIEPDKVDRANPSVIHTHEVRRISGIKSRPIAVRTSKILPSKLKQNSLHRLDSAPSPGQLPTPLDVVDSKDGHIWRAKYCVLWDGCLYFYQNEVQGESPEAIEERLQQVQLTQRHMSTQAKEPADLSKSPLPRKFLTAGNLNALNGNHTNNHDDIWEKRVALNRVVSARSAEIEYGEFVFELVADDGDKLILRASNGDELNEWLFQFHRSLAFFVKTAIDAYYSQKANGANEYYNASAALDIPSAWGTPTPPEVPLSVNDLSFLSHFQQTPWVDSFLIPVHGRSGLHRRRISQPPNSLSDSQGPEKDGTEEPITSKSLAPQLKNDSLETQRDNVFEVGQSREPELLKEPPSENKANQRYLPPFRRQLEAMKNGGTAPYSKTPSTIPKVAERNASTPLKVEVVETIIPDDGCVRGGCADPKLIRGSIVDAMYKKRKSSRVGQTERVEAFGCFGGGSDNESELSLHWEVGAVSECGTRETNEDSFLICSDAKMAFGTLENYEEPDHWGKHNPGLFGIFDGHCGNEAARFVTERFTEYFYNEWKQKSEIGPSSITDAIQKALQRLDQDFCRLCVEDGRDWDSGSTALVLAIVDEKLIVSSLGDCRAVVCRSALPHLDPKVELALCQDGWSQLKVEENFVEQWKRATSSTDSSDDDYTLRDFYWKEVAEVHTLARADEKERIESANGWITVEKDAQYSQMKRLDFSDEDVVEILQRCFSEFNNQSQPFGTKQKKFSEAPKLIERLCGDLSVTRALGDRDFKAEFNMPKTESVCDRSSLKSLWWDSPIYLPFPDGHSLKFNGDLVSSQAETRVLSVSNEDYVDEFIVIACDGLWDVLDPDEAVRVTRQLLFEKKWSAKKAGARLAELAFHLGSSDNITVIVIRFFHSANGKS